MARRRMPPPRNLKRSIQSTAPKHTIDIFCEGKTEKDYLDTLACLARQFGAKIYLHHNHKGKPIKLVQDAKKCRDKRLKESKKITGSPSKKAQIRYPFEVWVVCDRDEHHSYEEAAKLAATWGIGFAYSNPCIELWALLHFANQEAHITGKSCQKELKKYLPKYCHHKRPYFETQNLRPLEEKAKSRAIALQKRHLRNQTSGQNPSTTIWKLVDVLKAGNSAKARQKTPAFWTDADPN